MPNFEQRHVENSIVECWNVRAGERLWPDVPILHAIRLILSPLSSSHPSQVLNIKSSVKVADSLPGSNLRPRLSPATLMHSLLLSVLPDATLFLWKSGNKKGSSIMAVGLLQWGEVKGEEDLLACSGVKWWVLRWWVGDGRTQWQMPGYKGIFLVSLSGFTKLGMVLASEWIIEFFGVCLFHTFHRSFRMHKK